LLTLNMCNLLKLFQKRRRRKKKLTWPLVKSRHSSAVLCNPEVHYQLRGISSTCEFLEGRDHTFYINSTLLRKRTMAMLKQSHRQ
jgi:hypothetical protein